MAAQKKLEKESQYAHLDIDGDGIVTDEELDMDERMMRLENEDKRQDAQRNMAWFALAGMLLYPSGVVIALLLGLNLKLLSVSNPLFPDAASTKAIQLLSSVALLVAVVTVDATVVLVAVPNRSPLK